MAVKDLQTLGKLEIPDFDVPFINLVDKRAIVLVRASNDSNPCEGCLYAAERNACISSPICADGAFVLATDDAEIQVCTTCGSPRVYLDAFKAINSDDVLTYDSIHCMDCEGESSTHAVTVPFSFILETDFWVEEKPTIQSDTGSS